MNETTPQAPAELAGTMPSDAASAALGAPPIWLLWGLVWLVLMAGKRSLWELISLLWLIWLV